MKKLILLLTLVLSLNACRSVQKMVDKGNYDEALYTAIKRLQGKKNKKTKYVAAVEEAFDKITARDMAQIQHLKNERKGENWDDIIHIYYAIENRQERIRPMLPLISKDGYQANFRFVKTSNAIKIAEEQAAEYHYNYALELINDARNGNKYAAKQAHEELNRIKVYFNHYKNMHDLYQEAHFLGTTNVLIKTINQSNVFLPKRYENEILAMNAASLNDYWTNYDTREKVGKHYDIHAIISLNHLDISPEREFVNHHVQEKEIENGFKYKLDKNGNVKKDSLGNDIKIKKYKTIKARITEVIRTKSAIVDASINFFDMNNESKIKTEHFTVETVFEDKACSFKGNRRAIGDGFLSLLKDYPAPFPTDEWMVIDSANKLKNRIHREIKAL